MSYTKTDMLSHKIIEILKEHSDESTPLLSSRSAVILRKSLA